MSCDCKHKTRAEIGLEQMAVMRGARFGQAAPAPEAPTVLTPLQQAQEQAKREEGVIDAIKKVTPTLFVVGIATGMAMAIGSGIINYYIWSRKKK